MDNQTEGSYRAKDVVTRYRPDEIMRFERNGSHFQFFCKNGVILRLHLLTHSIIRLRYSLDGDFQKDFSYAIDRQFKPTPIEVFLDEEIDKYIISTEKLRCEVLKKQLLVNIYDSFGNVLCEDDTGFYRKESIMEGITQLKVTKKSPKGKQYYGLGDKTCRFNMRGLAVENWNTDAFGYGKDTDPLYRSIPFYYALDNGKAYGIFLDNTYRTRFSFDRKANGVSSFEARGGEMNYYFIYGPELLSVTTQYMQLTGKAAMPPIWTLGYHQCRWSYYPESTVRQLAHRFRAEQIPCDAIYFDIDYMDKYRCFTWDLERFPRPSQLIADLKADGFQSVVMIDPGIKVDKNYWVYQSGLANDVFCKREDGRLMKGPVWPPECVFPDYTNPMVRKWWGGLYKNLMLKNNVAGVWNDMNEPAVFRVESKTFPTSVRHHYDGNPCSHKKAHNIYGMQMSRATVEGLKKLQPKKRPFVITRATFAGGQRFASVWTGDNVASWEHLHLANIQCQRMSISGFSFIGTDIGGFADNPDGELFVRWLQLGIFHPLYRSHSMGYNLDGGTPISQEKAEELKTQGIIVDQEPWAYGEPFTTIARQAIELRYQLLPYLYTAFWNYHKTGDPILKPLMFYDQSDEKTYGRESEFICGRQILVHPVSISNATMVTTYLPYGEWFDYWTDTLYTGQQTIETTAQLRQIPIFIKAGAIIPHYPVMQHTKERPVDILTLHVYYKQGISTSQLYEDEGEGHGYQKGDYCLKTFEYRANANALRINQTQEGNYRPTYERCHIVFHGLPFDIQECKVDGKFVLPKGEVHEVPADFKILIVK